jgi:peptidoglycan hydrolase-like protein with peptidoglycan-binding domain
LNGADPDTQAEIDRMGAEIAAFWQRNGIDVASASQFIGEEVKNRPGLAHHGDVQPWDRSDAWSRREDRWVFDSLLLQAIERHSGEAPAVIPTPTQPVPVAPESIYKNGSTGDKVREIQNVVGVAVDGVFGPQTETAVRQWQSNLGIDADGVWGPATEEATHNLFVFLANLPAVAEVAPDNAFFVALADARSQVLQQGSTGGSVKILQVGLNGKGYALVGDGVFGPATYNSVRNFQSDSGISVDGIVGPQTWSALLS